ncbi:MULTISPECIES: DUF6286 domain-containing protein [unclassified Pseudoclavibacter]|uniref:DUF6286 domain-containing protein n=1 Tax=unclassified Pseudoclavibacter TaxID=2615177 RepID=UPI001BAE0073|nr:DUF6286 domain-containing protein [Pseudoclavibacter sp. Marseille-Q4354]MBS3179333.1 hypothetical protein [Pseudoclavibacter sp. Marseille-Q4354]
MSTNTSLYSRLSRRETHSPRSALAITLAVLLILVAAWIGTEIVLSLLALPALLVAPADMFASALGVLEQPAQYVGIAGVVVAIIGLVLLIAGLAPGRRARHTLTSTRTATVADNAVIASALARHAAHAGNVSPDNVTVSVSHRRADVHLTPASGLPVDASAITAAVNQQLQQYELTPRVTAKVRVAENGKVGA